MGKAVYNNRPRVEIGPEILHGLDWDLSNGFIDEDEYDEILQQISDKQAIAIIRYDKELN